MQIRFIGALRTLAKWEDLLATLPQHAEGSDGLGRIWENENPPRSAGQDPIVKQGWRLAVYRGVEFKILEDDVSEVIEVAANMSKTGKPYTLIRLGRTAMHLHGVNVADGRVVGDVHVCARVFWPKGADERENDGSTKPWRNYLLYVDIYPSTTEVTQRLEVYPEGSRRSALVMLGETDDLDGTPVAAWATRSPNWKPTRGEQPSVGSDQLLFFVPRT